MACWLKYSWWTDTTSGEGVGGAWGGRGVCTRAHPHDWGAVYSPSATSDVTKKQSERYVRVTGGTEKYHSARFTLLAFMAGGVGGQSGTANR